MILEFEILEIEEPLEVPRRRASTGPGYSSIRGEETGKKSRRAGTSESRGNFEIFEKVGKKRGKSVLP